jgi:hypothetical protein
LSIHNIVTSWKRTTNTEREAGFNTTKLVSPLTNVDLEVIETSMTYIAPLPLPSCIEENLNLQEKLKRDVHEEPIRLCQPSLLLADILACQGNSHGWKISMHHCLIGFVKNVSSDFCLFPIPTLSFSLHNL